MTRAMEIIAGRYELLDVLGRGGMGVVYRGHDRLLDRTVAVKILPAHYASDTMLVERFEREARAAARLSHPNIVAVFDTGRDATVRYFVMECIPGLSLAELLNERGPLPVEEAVAIAAQVADALSAAHAAAIVHRDIKPGNVMVEPSGFCKVLDFGIARAAAEAAMTQTSALLGSAPYMAPETALGEPAAAHSDIYALGCVLYEMLTDRPPFRGELPAAIINQHLNVAPRPASEFAPDVPPRLDSVLLRMLAKEPADRPLDAAETAAALRASIANAAAAPAAPPTPQSRTPAPRTAVADPAARARATRPTRPSAIPRERSRLSAWWLVLTAVIALLIGGAIAVVAAYGPGQPSATSSAVPPVSSAPSSAGHRSSTARSAQPSTASTSTSTPRSTPSSTGATSSPSSSSSTSTLSSTSSTSTPSTTAPGQTTTAP